MANISLWSRQCSGGEVQAVISKYLLNGRYKAKDFLEEVLNQLISLQQKKTKINNKINAMV